jgi:protein MAK11
MLVCLFHLTLPQILSVSVKAVETLSIALRPTASHPTSTKIVCTISSDGKIHIYDLASVPASDPSVSSDKKVQIEPVAVYDTKGTRLTCVTIADGDVQSKQDAGVKRKRAHEDEDSEGEDEECEGDEDAWVSDNTQEELQGERDGNEEED